MIEIIIALIVLIITIHITFLKRKEGYENFDDRNVPVNTFDLWIKKTNNKITQILDEELVFVVYSDTIINIKDCENVNIRVLTESSRNIFKVIAKCNNLIIDDNQFNNSKAFKNSAHATLIPRKYVGAFFSKNKSKINIIDYINKIDRSKLAFYIPFYRKSHIGLHMFLIFDTLKYSSTNESSYVQCKNKIICEKENFYSLFFKFAGGKAAIVHEEYAKSPSIVISHRINMTKIKQKKDAYLKCSINLDEIHVPLAEMDILYILQNNKYPGRYIVQEISLDDAAIIENMQSRLFSDFTVIFTTNEDKNNINFDEKNRTIIAEINLFDASLENGINH